MSEQQASEVAILEGLMNAIGVECPECGEINPTDAEECEFCAAELEGLEEEGPSFSLMHRVGVGDIGAPIMEGLDPAMAKIPAGESKNLMILRQAIEKVRMNEISLDEYRRNVAVVLNVARNGVELFNSDILKKQMAQFDEGMQSVVWDAGVLYEDFFAGCERMMEYEGGANTGLATEGLEIVETALLNMDQLHDEVISIAKEIQEEDDEEDGG